MLELVFPYYCQNSLWLAAVRWGRVALPPLELHGFGLLGLDHCCTTPRSVRWCVNGAMVAWPTTVCLSVCQHCRGGIVDCDFARFPNSVMVVGLAVPAISFQCSDDAGENLSLLRTASMVPLRHVLPEGDLSACIGGGCFQKLARPAPCWGNGPAHVVIEPHVAAQGSICKSCTHQGLETNCHLSQLLYI